MDPPTNRVQLLEARIMQLEAELALTRSELTRARSRLSWWSRQALVYALKIALTVAVAFFTARGCATPSTPTKQGEPRP